MGRETRRRFKREGTDVYLWLSIRIWRRLKGWQGMGLREKCSC